MVKGRRINELRRKAREGNLAKRQEKKKDRGDRYEVQMSCEGGNKRRRT